MLKKYTVPKSNKVSIATSDKPVMIAGLESGIKTLRENFPVDKPNILLVSIISDDWLVKVDLEKI